MNQEEYEALKNWEDWFHQHKSKCETWDQRKLEDSVELQLAVSQKKYEAAEHLAIEIVGGKNRKENKANKKFKKMMKDYLP